MSMSILSNIIDPYGPPPSLPIPNSSEYVNPRTLNIYNSGRPIYPEYTVPVNNSNPSLNYSGYGSYGPPQPPTASYYPPMQPNYDPYGHYPNIPPPLPPSTGYGYPSLPVFFFHFFTFFSFSDLYLEATHVILCRNLTLFLSIFIHF
jgi:hypothetical protein